MRFISFLSRARGHKPFGLSVADAAYICVAITEINAAVRAIGSGTAVLKISFEIGHLPGFSPMFLARCLK
jgi:hypothetical protein